MNKELLQENKSSFKVLAFSVTHLCNLSCSSCYLPKRDNFDFSLNDMKRIISEFKGAWIRLSGGEPTLRENLPQIIEYIVKNGKKAALLTNGLRLADSKYVKCLKNAGLNWIHFSLNGLNDNVYKKIDGQRLLKVKLKALRNIKREKIPTALSIMLVKGINENELRKIYRYCLRNTSFIKQLRIRSSVGVGRYAQEECFYLSEIVGMVSKIIGISKETLVDHSLGKVRYYSAHNTNHMPCHLEANLFSLLMCDIDKNRKCNYPFRIIQIIFKLMLKIGIINLIQVIFRKATKKEPLLEFSLRIRAWPDKYRIDLGEIQRCPSAYVAGPDNRIFPFCYALILNENDNIL